MNFKTKALYNFLLYLEKRFPERKDVIRSYYPKFASLDLNETNHYENFETYHQSQNLNTGEKIYITWNIDSIINYVKDNHITPDLLPVKLIYNSEWFRNENPVDFLKKSKPKYNGNNPKSDYIIVGKILFFEEYTIIDGNHRFCKALLSNQENIKIILIVDDISKMFLLGDSRKFIDYLEEILIGYC